MTTESVAIFTLEGSNYKIQCKREEKMKDICDRFISKLGLNKNNIVLIYNGDKINNDLTFIEQANENDKINNEMNILVYNITEYNNSLVKTKDVICPNCKENCIMSIVDYKINARVDIS